MSESSWYERGVLEDASNQQKAAVLQQIIRQVIGTLLFVVLCGIAIQAVFLVPEAGRQNDEAIVSFLAAAMIAFLANPPLHLLSWIDDNRAWI